MIRLFIVLFACSVCQVGYGQSPRWHMKGNEGIKWSVQANDTPHTDHMEMSGKQVSAIVTFGTSNGQGLVLDKKLYFPMLRTIPNETRGSLNWNTSGKNMPPLVIDGVPANEKVVSFSINGILTIQSALAKNVTLERRVFPSTTKAAVIEQCRITNNGNASITLQVPARQSADTTDPKKGVYGSYVLSTTTYGFGGFALKPGEDISYAVVYSARKTCDQPYDYSASYEYIKRMQFVQDMQQNLVLQTPDSIVNKMFGFAKIRVTESIYDTKGGLMHGPGGGSYYAAIWANDQAEYVDPFFPFLGNAEGNESAINSFRWFAKFMNDDYKPIPSSIIAEGVDVWNGAGDRGDQAMIAYGAARFALAYGDKDEAKKLWPLIDWCLEFLRKKKTSQGVIQSDADELEGRFPAGKINLSTNTLAYGALISGADLAVSLNDNTKATQLRNEATTLRKNIEQYFGSTVQGYTTYRYYDGNDKLRSWIGMPLTMGIFDRKEGTLKALYSPYLWTKSGMLTEAGSDTYWDRALLYALRGTFYAGSTDSAAKYLSEYSRKRLLGEHVPYAIEAWPEGNQRHLAAESGLYCRVITEGLFGIRVTGFNKFLCQPVMPKGWQHMSLKKLHLFQSDFDIDVARSGGQYQINIRHSDGSVQKFNWNGMEPLEIRLKPKA
ncbi:hypothetical protein QTN47_15035 [Danxiaibacter flavus]|uniref:Alpha-L-rhamnosidase six-hairpin glycosidase domain-containing protein n=1 Tax=Danxiaibacter flavus TaxID=3049108 RepID=A0ABV3ZGZ1_9BACT|nr:hypothetical protein QNM32_15045 [Chitinophagaceae bacterium DXS]